MIPEEGTYPYFAVEAGYKQFDGNGQYRTIIIVISMNHSEGLEGARLRAQQILEGKFNHPNLLDGRIPNWIRIAEISKYHYPWPDNESD